MNVLVLFARELYFVQQFMICVNFATRHASKAGYIIATIITMKLHVDTLSPVFILSLEPFSIHFYWLKQKRNTRNTIEMNSKPKYSLNSIWFDLWMLKINWTHSELLFATRLTTLHLIDNLID